MKPSLQKILLPLILLVPFPAIAEVRLPNLFGDHMVLQKEKPVRVWGWANPGESVEVRFAGQVRQTKASAKTGQWLVELKPLEASPEGRPLTVTGNNKVTLDDVVVGEVWVCGGQSNMEWSLRATRDADVEIASANSPGIRFIRLPKMARVEPQDDFPVKSPENPEGNWRQAIPDQGENCTGVGYYFARRLHRFLKVPIGLIDISWGGTMAQHWCTKETLRGIPEVEPYFEKFETKLDEWEKGGREEGAKKRYEADLKAYRAARAQWEKTREGRQPRGPNSNAYTNPANKGQILS